MEAAACLLHRVPAFQSLDSHVPSSRSVILPSPQFSRTRVRILTSLSSYQWRRGMLTVTAIDNSAKKAVPNSNYVVPLDNPPASSCITRPLAEILRDLNKRVPDKVIKGDGAVESKYIPWYHANRMLSFYAPGWCGELRNVLFSADGRTVSVVYRVTIRGSDGEAYRESSGTVSLDDDQFADPVQMAEAMAFRRACARFGLGLYLYHEDEIQ